MRESFCEIPIARVSAYRNFRQLQPKAFPLHLVNSISRNKLYFYEGSDCGLFAIAFAYELADGNDPSDVSFDQGKNASTFSLMLREDV